MPGFGRTSSIGQPNPIARQIGAAPYAISRAFQGGKRMEPKHAAALRGGHEVIRTRFTRPSFEAQSPAEITHAGSEDWSRHEGSTPALQYFKSEQPSDKESTYRFGSLSPEPVQTQIQHPTTDISYNEYAAAIHAGAKGTLAAERLDIPGLLLLDSVEIADTLLRKVQKIYPEMQEE